MMLFPQKDVPGLIVGIGDHVINRRNPKDSYKVMRQRRVPHNDAVFGHNEYQLKRDTDGKKCWVDETFIHLNATVVRGT